MHHLRHIVNQHNHTLVQRFEYVGELVDPDESEEGVDSLSRDSGVKSHRVFVEGSFDIGGDDAVSGGAPVFAEEGGDFCDDGDELVCFGAEVVLGVKVVEVGCAD